MERTAAMGHKGVAFTQDPGYFDQPVLTDRYWDPMWASAQEKGMPINFHIASGDLNLFDVGHPDNGIHANYAAMGVSFFLANARTVAQLVTGGICHRFPDLNFVSVESGIGWIPFILDALDYQMQETAPRATEYLSMKPSEYFRRQIYACFWFERAGVRFALEQYPDNMLFETDFPHPTCQHPGPRTPATEPRQYADEVLGDLPEPTVRKVLYENAARLYSVDLSLQREVPA
jgi:predicted TIM-barrel fold metal-dependent hydrolase